MADQSAPLVAPERVITITRRFEAPRELVWREWTEPARFAAWFGGPESEVPLSTVSLDLRPGGAWSATTLAYGTHRRDVRWTGEYLEVSEPSRLVFTISGLRGERAPDVVTVTFVDLGDARTEMLFRQYGHGTPEQYERAKARWAAEFDRITERLCQQRQSGHTRDDRSRTAIPEPPAIQRLRPNRQM